MNRFPENIFSQPIQRRTFLRGTSLIAIAACVPLSHGCDEPDPDASAAECSTTDDILGPFYKAGAPLRENIVPDNSSGVPLIVTGTVYANCENVLAGAIVEIWNADHEGEYDTSDEFRFRGRYATNQNGTYRFRTIVPGRYLNGGTFRPSHIHFRVNATGHRELVSQIYFKDDPFIASDPWAGSVKASERILTISKDTSGVDTVNFDIYLTVAT
ncbi:MAG TPA: hypothetical protein VEB86_04345 [Chryseosolibacter sp.]|nr:hypothetical protein [Chryseosolibacter sp.]